MLYWRSGRGHRGQGVLPQAPDREPRGETRVAEPHAHPQGRCHGGCASGCEAAAQPIGKSRRPVQRSPRWLMRSPSSTQRSAQWALARPPRRGYRLNSVFAGLFLAIRNPAL